MNDCETGNYDDNCNMDNYQHLCKDTDADVKNYMNKLCPTACAMPTTTRACEENPMICPDVSPELCTTDDFATKIAIHLNCPRVCGICPTATNVTPCGNDYVGPVPAQFANCTAQANFCQYYIISHLCPETCWKSTGCDSDFGDCSEFQILCRDTDEDIKNYVNKLCPETCAKTPTAPCENVDDYYYDDYFCNADMKIHCDDANFDEKFLLRLSCPQL